MIVKDYVNAGMQSSRQSEVFKSAHSDLVYDKIEDYGLEFDCVIEAKMKEISVIKQINNWHKKEIL